MIPETPPMRAGIGLLVLLVTVALMLLLYTSMPGSGNKSYMHTVATANREMTQFGNQLNGKSPDGETKFEDSVAVAGENGRYTITSVMTNGPAEVRFGFLVNDKLIRIGQFDVRDAMNINNADDAMLWMRETYTRNGTIVVERNGKQIELPTTAHRLKTQDKMPSLSAPLQGTGVGTH
jgi:hypothetical protein